MKSPLPGESFYTCLDKYKKLVFRGYEIIFTLHAKQLIIFALVGCEHNKNDDNGTYLPINFLAFD